MGNIITWEGKQYEQVPSVDPGKCNFCAFKDVRCNKIELETQDNAFACIGKWYYKEVQEEKVSDEETERQKLADEIRRQTGKCKGINCYANNTQSVNCPCYPINCEVEQDRLDYINEHYPEKKPECQHDCSTCKHTYEKKVEFIPGKVYKDGDGLLVLCTNSKGSCKDDFTGYLITDDPTLYGRFSGCWGGWIKAAFTPVEIEVK